MKASNKKAPNRHQRKDKLKKKFQMLGMDEHPNDATAYPY